MEEIRDAKNLLKELFKEVGQRNIFLAKGQLGGERRRLVILLCSKEKKKKYYGSVG